MCGRYTLTDDGTELWEVIEASVPKELRKGLRNTDIRAALCAPERRRFNVVPTSHEPVILAEEGFATIHTAHWWICPAWASGQVTWKTDAHGGKSFAWKGPRKSHFNSRWDTVTDPSNRYWHGLLEQKRCLVPADGFVEWPDDALRDKEQPKIPRYFGLHARRPFFFAGVYDVATDDTGTPFLSFNILTVEPNALLRALPHHRMPAILAEESVGAWLDPRVSAAQAATLLRPTQDDRMVSYPISTRVNLARNEAPDLLLPVDLPEGRPVELPDAPRLDL